MLTQNLSFVSLRALLAPAALALSLAACDGIDDQDALAAEDELAEDELVSASAAPKVADDVAEEAGAAPAGPFDITNANHPSAGCYFYSTKTSLALYDAQGVHGDVTLHTNCGNVYARTTVDDWHVTAANHRIMVRLEYWSGNLGVWLGWQTKDNWSTSKTFGFRETDPTTLPVGTYVRACGTIEGGTLLVSSQTYPGNCTPYFQLSAST